MVEKMSREELETCLLTLMKQDIDFLDLADRREKNTRQQLKRIEDKLDRLLRQKGPRPAGTGPR